METNIKKNLKQNGYTLVEMVLYVSILSIFFVIIINSLISLTQPYRQVLALRILERSGIDSMERITREIRSASAVDTVNSILGTNPGVLVLTATANGVSTTTKFYVQNSVLKVDVNGVYEGPLSSASTTVTNLIFYKFSNSSSTGVKFDVTFQTTLDGTTKIKKYHSTVMLKGL